VRPPDWFPHPYARPAATDADWFWAERTAPRLARLPEPFYGPAPPREMPFSLRATLAPLRFGATLAAFGFFGVLLSQLAVLVLLPTVALGAPIFEEFLKFGLALLLVSLAFGRRHGPGVVVVRVLLAAAVGAAFGWFEHTFAYRREPDFEYVGRVLFHAASPVLSMAVFCVVESLADRRARWFSTLPASLVHYANNAFGVLIAIFFDGQVALVWSAVMVAVAVVAAPLVAVLRAEVRAQAQRQVALRFPVASPVPPQPEWRPS